MSKSEELEAAAKHWEQLAEDEDKSVREGISLSPQVSERRASIYRNTAEALRIQIRTGVAVCSCCHLPLKQTSY